MVALVWRTGRMGIQNADEDWHAGWVFWEDRRGKVPDRRWPSCFSVGTKGGYGAGQTAGSALCWAERVSILRNKGPEAGGWGDAACRSPALWPQRPHLLELVSVMEGRHWGITHFSSQSVGLSGKEMTRSLCCPLLKLPHEPSAEMLGLAVWALNLFASTTVPWFYF